MQMLGFFAALRMTNGGGCGLLLGLAGEVEGEVLGGGGAGAGGAAEGGVAGVEEGALDGFGSFEEVADGEELDAGILAALCAGRAGRGVEAGFGGFAEHGLGAFLNRDKYRSEQAEQQVLLDLLG